MMQLNTPEQIALWDGVHARMEYAPTAPEGWLANTFGLLDGAAQPVLDLGCGRGRHVLWLVRKGWRVTGMDWSQVALTHTKESLDQAGLFAPLIKQDFRRLDTGSQRYKYVIATRTLNHGYAVDFQRTLTSIRNVLTMGGLLIFNVPTVRNEPLNVMNGRWLEDHTLVLDTTLEAGIPHHFFTEEEIRECARPWRNIEVETVVEPLPPGHSPLHDKHINEWLWVVLTR